MGKLSRAGYEKGRGWWISVENVNSSASISGFPDTYMEIWWECETFKQEGIRLAYLKNWIHKFFPRVVGTRRRDLIGAKLNGMAIDRMQSYKLLLSPCVGVCLLFKFLVPILSTKTCYSPTRRFLPTKLFIYHSIRNNCLRWLSGLSNLEPFTTVIWALCVFVCWHVFLFFFNRATHWCTSMKRNYALSVVSDILWLMTV